MAITAGAEAPCTAKRSIAAPISLAVLAFVAACSAPTNHIAAGEALLAEQKYREAAIEFRNAIALDNRSGLAHYRLAQAMALGGDEGNAVGEFVRAADLLPDDLGVQLDATRALLRVGLFEDARTRAEGVLKKDPRNVDALVLRAHATASLKDFEAAIDSIEGAIELDPTRSASYVRLGALRAMTVGSSDAEVEAAYKQAIAVAPEAPGPHLALANHYFRTGRLGDAERAIRAAISVDPKNPKSHRALARLLLMMNRENDAENALRAAADNSGLPDDQLALGDYLATRKRFDDALVVFQQLATREEAAAAARARIAGIRYEQGHPSDAHRLLDELITSQPGNGELLVVKGRWLLAEKKFDEAFAQASLAVEVSPKLPAAHALAGAVHAARGRVEDAIKLFNEVIALAPRSVEGHVALARLYLAAGRSADALTAAREALRIAPTSGDAQFELARALFATGDANQASDELRRVLEVAADYGDVQTLLGQIQHRQGNRAAARQAFDHALQLDPESVEALTGLVTLDVGDKQIAQAVRRVEARVKEAPDNAPLLLLAARTYATAGNIAAAESMLRRAIEIDPAYLPAYNVLGQLYVQQSRLDDARREYEALAAKRPNNVAALTMVAMIHQVQNKPDEARKHYEKILSIDPGAIVAANNLAFMYAESGGNLDIALQLAQAAKAKAPNDPDINDTLGWVYYKRDLPSLAIDPLEQSVRADGANPIYHYHLGLVYLKTGNKDKARAALERALELSPNFDGAAEARKALASLRG